MISRVQILIAALTIAGIAVFHPSAHAAQPFKELVGSVAVGEVASGPLQVPYITWGGDAATFYANGGLTTAPGSLFQTQGLNLKLRAGDDFVQQVRDYLSGKSPFLRGTFHMMGLASEVIGSDPRTKGVVILQMTWSAGDHMVSRNTVKTVNDLKGKTIAIQQGGPHVGMLDDILKSAQLSWDDIKVVWAKDLTGSPDSPAELLRSRNDIDACFVITPDMIGLCGGLQNTGSGAEGTVKGVRVLVSTAELSRSIADVYVCRKDFYDKNKALITKFAAGYMRACETVLDLKKTYESKGSPEYIQLLKMVQDIYGQQTIPTLEEDAHGLIADATFVGYPGNVAFFTGKNNLAGFDAFQTAALDLAVRLGYAKVKTGLLPSGLDYNSPLFRSYLTKLDAIGGERFRAEAVAQEIEELSAGGDLDDRTILSFTVNFAPNQNEFSDIQYGAEFQRVVELASKYGNAVIAIRGHADPSKTLLELVKSGMAKGVLKRSGTTGNYTYSLEGRPLDLSQTQHITELVEKGAFDGVPGSNPRETMQAALNLSLTRAEAVRDSVITYANGKDLRLDKSQIQPLGVGIREPFIAKPANMDEAQQNMRVEFRLLRVLAEASTQSDFDF
ncbi:MAG: ABC transporter substrate-binding protein [Candidatus Hydrogenedentes bacterium]|nr:ABC transporter substrate-binding protein [Candidatus Hydrogenedentota bacterium]